MFGVLIVEPWNPTSLHPKSSKTISKICGESPWTLSTNNENDENRRALGSGNDWTAFCNQFRRSLLFEAKCQRMSMTRCLWGLEKDYRLKFKSVICVHYSVGCKSCKHLLCRLVYYPVSCTHYSVSCKHSLCRQVERHLLVVNIYFVGCTNYSVSYVHYLLGQL